MCHKSFDFLSFYCVFCFSLLFLNFNVWLFFSFCMVAKCAWMSLYLGDGRKEPVCEFLKDKVKENKSVIRWQNIHTFVQTYVCSNLIIIHSFFHLFYHLCIVLGEYCCFCCLNATADFKILCSKPASQPVSLSVCRLYWKATFECLKK